MTYTPPPQVISYATFTTDFPEFAGSQYPVGWFNFWQSVGQKMLRTCVWQDMIYHGLALFIAHHMAVQLRNVKAAASGGDAGANTGPIANKSVDKVSVGYDTGAASIEGQGHWNLTTYGTQFIQLARMLGIGGVQASGWCGGEESLYYGEALAQWQDGNPRWQ